MLLFPLYAALVWYGCYRWRRRFVGFAIYAAGVLALVMLAYLDVRLMRWMFNSPPSPSLLLLLCAEAGMVALVGALVVCSPRERAAKPCRACGYELEGLDDANPRCPECGLEGAALEPTACPGCGRLVAADPAGQGLCGECAGRGKAPAAA
jgi:hypothetical protein